MWEWQQYISPCLQLCDFSTTHTAKFTFRVCPSSGATPVCQRTITGSPHCVTLGTICSQPQFLYLCTNRTMKWRITRFWAEYHAALRAIGCFKNFFYQTLTKWLKVRQGVCGRRVWETHKHTGWESAMCWVRICKERSVSSTILQPFPAGCWKLNPDWTNLTATIFHSSWKCDFELILACSVSLMLKADI